MVKAFDMALAEKIGTDVQAQSAQLDLLAALTTAAYGRALLELATAAGLRTAAGLVIGTDVAAIASPALTGNPAAPTQTVGDNSTRLATTAFANAASIWGDPIATANFSASPNVDFTGLSAYRELLLLGFGVAHADGASQSFVMRISDDAGSVYDATGYINAGTSLTSGLMVANSLPAATPFDFQAHLVDFNNATYKTRATVTNGRQGSTAGPTYSGRYSTARVNNALSFTNPNAINLTAGEFLLYGRKG